MVGMKGAVYVAIGFVGRFGISIPDHPATLPQDYALHGFWKCFLWLLVIRSLFMEGVSSKHAQPYMGVGGSEAVGVSLWLSPRICE
jgi:hypothetical protein